MNSQFPTDKKIIMSQTIQIPDVTEFMTRHLVDVFDTMLSMKAMRVPGTELPAFDGRVTGSVGFGGEHVTGAVYLHLSESFAKQVAAAMLGITPEEISDEQEVNDVVGEATNMITGGLKSWLCDAGSDCAVSTPAIIRGTSYSIEPSPDATRECLLFECGDNRIVVEIHIKIG
jgi:chemotaxis protein CheX